MTLGYRLYSEEERANLNLEGRPYGYVRLPNGAFVAFTNPVDDKDVRAYSAMMEFCYEQGKEAQRMVVEDAFRAFLDSFQDPRQPILPDGTDVSL